MYYRCLNNLNLYDSAKCDRLASQIAKGEYIEVESEQADFLNVKAIADQYPGYIRKQDQIWLQPSTQADLPISQDLTIDTIANLLPKVIDYALAAQKVENHYLWGGKLPPNFDCSGLVQSAFSAVGIQIPRDAYQQEDFAFPIKINSSFNDWLQLLQPADLIFFGIDKATHVGLYLGDRQYVHSSGKEHGHNRIAIDQLLDLRLELFNHRHNSDQISQKVAKHYARQLRGAGRIRQNYCRDR